MLAAYLLIPGITAVANRFWRGEGNLPKWGWLLFMTALSAIAQSWQFSAAWLLFILGYAVPPTQALFSAVTNRPPGRKDSPAWQWMQTLTNKLCENDDWEQWGIMYGYVRALLMVPGIIAIGLTSNIINILYGLPFMLLGLIYYASARIRDHFELPEDKAIPIAEVILGWMIGTYLLICSL